MIDMARRYKETLIIVTHDQEIASYADRIIYLLDGNIKSDKPNESIMKTKREKDSETAKQIKDQKKNEEGKSNEEK